MSDAESETESGYEGIENADPNNLDPQFTSVIICVKCKYLYDKLIQAHRRVLGVVSVGSCANQIELHELCRLHEAVKNKFVSTLFDSRCVVLCEGKENGVEERANNDIYK